MASESDIPAPVREAMATMTPEQVAKVLRGEAGEWVSLYTVFNPPIEDSTRVIAALLLAAQAVERDTDPRIQPKGGQQG